MFSLLRTKILNFFFFSPTTEANPGVRHKHYSHSDKWTWGLEAAELGEAMS